MKEKEITKSVVFPESMLQALAKKSNKEDRSVSATIRLIIKESLEKEGLI